MISLLMRKKQIKLRLNSDVQNKLLLYFQVSKIDITWDLKVSFLFWWYKYSVYNEYSQRQKEKVLYVLFLSLFVMRPKIADIFLTLTVQ